MPDTAKDTLAESPKDPVTGQVKPHAKPGGRPGTEAQETSERRSPPRPAGEGPPAGEGNSVFRERDA